MRVCYLCADRGIALDAHKGAAAHVRGFARALGGLGHEVCVLTPVPGEAPPADLRTVQIATPALLPSIAGAVKPRMARALAHLLTNHAVDAALEEVVADFNPDLIYERYSPFSAAGALFARRAGIAHVLEVNAPLAWEGKQYRGQALTEAAEALEQAAFNAAGQIVAVSSELRPWLVNAGADGNSIAVLPNGVDNRLFTPQGPRWRRAAPGDVVIGFIGSLKPWHGLDLLARTFRRLAAADPRYQLLVVGEGPLSSVIDSLAAELPTRITRIGGVAHELVPEYLRGIDIAVAPYEATDHFYFSPLKVLEYMAAGVPTVASDIGQIGELVRDGETGLLIPPGDVDALVHAITQLAAAPELRARLGSAAVADVAARHTWEQRVLQVLQLAAVQQKERLLCSR